MKNLVEQTLRSPYSPLPLEHQDVFPPTNRIKLFVAIIRDPVPDHPSLLVGEDLHELAAV